MFLSIIWTSLILKRRLRCINLVLTQIVADVLLSICAACMSTLSCLLFVQRTYRKSNLPVDD